MTTADTRYYVSSTTHIMADQGHDSDLVLIKTRPCKSVDWMNGFRETGITASTTDEEIVEMAKAWSADSIENGGSRLDIPAVVSAAIDYRIELAREALGMDDEEEAA